jgi:signal transduction histidine kinase
MQLDNRTLAIIAVCTALLLNVLGFMILQTRPTFPGFRRWTAGNLAGAMALVLLGLRGKIPDGFSILAANALAIAASILFLEGSREFRGLRPRMWSAIAGGGLTIVSIFFFEFMIDDTHAAAIAFTLCLGVLSCAHAVILLKNPPVGRAQGFVYTGSVFGFIGVVEFARAYYVYAIAPQSGVFSPAPVNTFYYLASILMFVAWSFGFILMAKDRLIADLTDAENRAAATNQELGRAIERIEAASREASRADAAKSDFLSSVSHEIRTPMNGVIGMTGLLLDTELSPEQRDYTETIAQSGESLLSLINALLDLSKIEAGKLTLESVEFNPAHVVEEVIKLLSPRAKAKDVQLGGRGLEMMPRAVIGDAGRLKQILTNLIGNAVKFTENGRISVDVRSVDSVADRLWMSFEVTDTGIGISPDSLARLFQPYVQADGTISRRFGGTGLGLSIVKSLVDAMGGELSVTSELGLGSAFRFRVPFQTLRKIAQSELAPLAQLR